MIALTRSIGRPQACCRGLAGFDKDQKGGKIYLLDFDEVAFNACQTTAKFVTSDLDIMRGKTARFESQIESDPTKYKRASH
jgi:hypothetical protein